MNEEFFKYYWAHAPIALARERSLELYLMRNIPLKNKVLDIACGDGFFSSLLYSKLEKVIYGIDLNPHEVEKAKLVKTFSSVSIMDATNLSFPAGYFDVIYSNSSLEHISDIEKALKSIHKSLAHGGKLFLTLPTDKFEKYSVGSTIFEWFKLGKINLLFRKFYNRFWHHYHAYNVHDWILLFEMNGFRVQECKQYGSHKFCFINDLLTPLGAIGRLNIAIFKKWKILEPLWISLFKRLTIKEPFQIQKEIDVFAGGLVFFELKKIDAS
jgi:ubiquinone/menaquinone biosynthesis C-methylase UbiE